MTTPGIRSLLAVPLAAACMNSACRDRPAPFDAREPAEAPGEPSWRLTYSSGNDRMPAWAAQGDTLYYAARGFVPFPLSPSVLLAVPAEGGTAAAILESIQSVTGTLRWLTGPAPAPGGQRIAFAEIFHIHREDACSSRWVCSAVDTAHSVPPLRAVELRVRRFDEVGPLAADPGLRIDFDAIAFDTTRHPFGLSHVEIARAHPFQRLYLSEGIAPFRPSWAPDGRRLVYSDGLRLLTWSPESGEAPAGIPGTSDGISAAWSPDGQWIAYSRLERGTPVTFQCTCAFEGRVTRVQDRIVYPRGRRVLTLVRPDGSDRRELAEGDEPAWAPDGRSLCFRRGDRLWTVDLDRGTPVPLPGTNGGREPALSPDGRYLAFARPAQNGNLDLWIVSRSAAP